MVRWAEPLLHVEGLFVSAESSARRLRRRGGGSRSMCYSGEAVGDAAAALDCRRVQPHSVVAVVFRGTAVFFARGLHTSLAGVLVVVAAEIAVVVPAPSVAIGLVAVVVAVVVAAVVVLVAAVVAVGRHLLPSSETFSCFLPV